MAYGRILNQYQKTNIETAGKVDLVIMCYEKAIQFLNQARDFYERNEFENKAKAIQKALAILNELQTCLNIEQGGQIARNLDAIYSYLTRRLLEGDINRDVTSLEEAVRILSELKEGWEGITSQTGDQYQAETKPRQMGASAAQLAA